MSTAWTSRLCRIGAAGGVIGTLATSPAPALDAKSSRAASQGYRTILPRPLLSSPVCSATSGTSRQVRECVQEWQRFMQEWARFMRVTS
jgi:hypothetical protein